MTLEQGEELVKPEEVTEEEVQTQTSSDGKTLPQDEVNKLAGKIRQETEERMMKKLAKKWGITDLSQAEEIIKNHQTLQQESMSDVEKLTHERDELSKKLKQEETRRKAQDRISIQRGFFDKTVEKLKAEGARKPEDVIRLMTSAGLFRDVIKDGKVDEKAVEKQINAYKEKNKDYFIPTDLPDTPDNNDGRPRVPKRKPVKAKKFSY